MKDQLMLQALRLLPKNLFSRAVGAAAHAHLPGPITRASIKAFARAYQVDLEEADRPVGEFSNLGDFFTRRLRTGARPVDRRPGVGVSPADGHILNAGRLNAGQLLQAKGREYSVGELLADTADAARFERGSWVTVYLSPRDYHRVHHPVEGKVLASRHLPGHLWPVNRLAVENIERLFCINERVITYVDSPLGDVATIMVGATSVGHISTQYDPELRTNRGGQAAVKHYEPPIRVARGDELGVFHLGSTVIVLFADPEVELEALAPDQVIRMGQAIARRPRQK